MGKRLNLSLGAPAAVGCVITCPPLIPLDLGPCALLKVCYHSFDNSRILNAAIVCCASMKNGAMTPAQCEILENTALALRARFIEGAAFDPAKEKKSGSLIYDMEFDD